LILFLQFKKKKKKTEKQKLRLFGDRVSHFEQGTPEAPQCGFSKRAVQILQTVGVEFASRDVLQDPELREGVKKFSNWPTIPQVFIGGEFVGGSDTLLEMMKAGDLDKILDEKKVKRIAQEKQ
jgi:monothiol glutaredoxin